MKTREQLDLPLFRKILVLESDHFEDITLSNVNNNAHGVLPCRVLVVHLGDQLLWIVRVRNIFLDLRWREVDMLSVEPQKKKKHGNEARDWTSPPPIRTTALRFLDAELSPKASTYLPGL